MLWTRGEWNPSFPPRFNLKQIKNRKKDSLKSVFSDTTGLDCRGVLHLHHCGCSVFLSEGEWQLFHMRHMSCCHLVEELRTSSSRTVTLTKTKNCRISLNFTLLVCFLHLNVTVFGMSLFPT